LYMYTGGRKHEAWSPSIEVSWFHRDEEYSQDLLKEIPPKPTKLDLTF